MKIAEFKPFLDEVLTTPLEAQLHRQAQIKAITYSNQIDGNRCDEKENEDINPFARAFAFYYLAMAGALDCFSRQF